MQEHAGKRHPLHPARRLLFAGFHGPGGLRLPGQIGGPASGLPEGASAPCLCGNALCGQAGALPARLTGAGRDVVSADGGADMAGRRRDGGIESPRSHGMGWTDERDYNPSQEDCHGRVGETITKVAGTSFGGYLPCFLETLHIVCRTGPSVIKGF